MYEKILVSPRIQLSAKSTLHFLKTFIYFWDYLLVIKSWKLTNSVLHSFPLWLEINQFKEQRKKKSASSKLKMSSQTCQNQNAPRSRVHSDSKLEMLTPGKRILTTLEWKQHNWKRHPIGIKRPFCSFWSSRDYDEIITQSNWQQSLI